MALYHYTLNKHIVGTAGALFSAEETPEVVELRRADDA